MENVGWISRAITETKPLMSATPTPASAPTLFKNVARSSAAYSIPFVVQRLAGFLLIPITTRFLTPSDFGIVDLLDQALTVIALLLGIRFASALGYFYFKQDSAVSRQRVASTAILGAALVGTGAALLNWPFPAQLSRLVFGNVSAAPYIRIALLTWPTGFAAEALFGLLRLKNRTGMYNLVSIMSLALRITAMLVLLVLLRLRVAGMLYSSVVTATLTTLFLSAYTFRSMPLVFDFRTFGRMAKYAMPLGVGSIATLIIHFGDRFFLPHYRPLAELGVYVLAYKIGMLMSFFYASFDSYWSAQIFQIFQREDSDRIFARMFTYVMLGLSSIGLALVVCAHPVLRIMVAPAYRGAAALIPVIVLAYFVRATGDFLRSVFMVTGRTGCDAITNWIGSLVCLASYWLLIPRFGAWGAAWATVLAFAIIAAISAVWTFRIRHYQLESGRLIKIGLGLGVAFLPYLALAGSSVAAQIAIAAASLAAFPAALWTLRFATPGEVQNARAGVYAVLHKLHW
jgi:O-antigen/teichoic acid export membrane protein